MLRFEALDYLFGTKLKKSHFNRQHPVKPSLYLVLLLEKITRPFFQHDVFLRLLLENDLDVFWLAADHSLLSEPINN